MVPPTVVYALQYQLTTKTLSPKDMPTSFSDLDSPSIETPFLNDSRLGQVES